MDKLSSRLSDTSVLSKTAVQGISQLTVSELEQLHSEEK